VTNFVGGAAEGWLAEGLYESLSTDALDNILTNEAALQPAFVDIDDNDSPEILSRHVADVLKTALLAAQPTERVAIANRVLQGLHHSDRISAGPTQLQSLHRPDALKRRHLRQQQR
jgi:hypothetical protein